MSKEGLSIGSPLDTLTSNQLRFLQESYFSGYYDIPLKISTDQLVKKLDIANSTFVMSRGRAEKR